MGMSDLHDGTASELAIQLQGFRLTTAQIYYHLPDHPRVLQEFIWQHYDLAPKFPKLHGFLHFWGKQDRWLSPFRLCRKKRDYQPSR